MYPYYRCVVSTITLAGAIFLAGCNQPPTTVSPADSAAIAPIGKVRVAPQTSAPPPAETPVEKPEAVAAELAPPLDLSLPRQLETEIGSLEAARVVPKRLLPDLFDAQPNDPRALSLRGRLLMNDTERQDLDTIQGGEITMEFKTR